MRQCHTQDLSKGNASPGDTQKALAPQAVLSHPAVGQESAWRQIVLVVDILSVDVAQRLTYMPHIRLLRHTTFLTSSTKRGTDPSASQATHWLSEMDDVPKSRCRAGRKCMATCKAKLTSTISTRGRCDNTPICQTVRVWLRAPKARRSSAVTSTAKAASLVRARPLSVYHSYAKALRATPAERQPTRAMRVQNAQSTSWASGCRGGRFKTSGSIGSVARARAGSPSVIRLIH